MTDLSPILAVLAILTAALPIATAAAIHEHHHRKDKPRMTTYRLQDPDNRDDSGASYELEGDASRITAYLDGPLRRDVRPVGITNVDEAIRALNVGDFDVARAAAVRVGVYLTEVHPARLDTEETPDA